MNSLSSVPSPFGDPSTSSEITLFVDWKSAANGGLRPAVVPSSWATDPRVLQDILLGLRGVVDRLLTGRDATVDTYLYGGFTNEAGADSPEFTSLTEALSTVSWTGRSDTSRVRYRDLATVVSLDPDDGSTRVHALFRARERVARPQLRVRGDACTCAWMKEASRTFGATANHDLRCPQCGVTRLSIETGRQRLVDTLLASHVLHKAAAANGSKNPPEIWVLSDDSDMLPAVCMANHLGARTVWLRTRALRRYGYRELAALYGVLIQEESCG